MSETASNTTVSLPAGAYVTVNGSHDTINTGAYSYLTISGSNDTINTGVSSNIYVNGSSDVLNVGNHSDVILLEGTGIKITLAFGDVKLDNGVNGAVLWGSYDFVDLGANAQINIHALYTNIEAANGDDVGLTAGSKGDALTLNNGALQVVNNVLGVNLTGSGDTVVFGATVSGNLTGNFIYGSLGQSDNVTLAGSGNLLIGTSDNILVNSGVNNSLDISSGVLTANTGVSNLTIVGTADTVLGFGINLLASIEGLHLQGSNDTVSVGNGSYVDLQSGNSDQITMTNSTLKLANDITATLIGTGDAIYGSDETLDTPGIVGSNIWGNDNTIDFTGPASAAIGIVGTGDVVIVNQSNDSVVIYINDEAVVEGSGANVVLQQNGATATASNDTVNMATGVTGTLSGSGDTIYATNATLDAPGIVASNIWGNGNTIDFIGSGASAIGIAGINDIVIANQSNDSVVIYSDYEAWVQGSNVNVVLQQNGASAVASNDTINIAPSVTVSLTGATDVIHANYDTLDSPNISYSEIYGVYNTINFTGPSAENIGILGTGDVVNTNNTGDNVIIYAGGEAYINGGGITIQLAANGAAAIASNDLITINSGLTVSLSGTLDTISGSYDLLEDQNITSGDLYGVYDSVYFTGPTGESINIHGTNEYVQTNNSSDIVSIDNGGEAYIGGSPATVQLMASGVSAVASGDHIYMVNGITGTLSGTLDTISGAYETLIAPNLTSSDIYGIDDMIDFTGSAGESVGIHSTGNIVQTNNSSDLVWMNQNATAYVYGSSASIDFVETGAAVTASGDIINMSGGVTASLTGNNDTVNVNSADNVLITGSNDTVIMGASNVVTLAAGDSGDTVNTNKSGNLVDIYSNAPVVVNGSGVTVALLDNGASVSASGDVINMYGGVSAALTGNSDTVYSGTADDIVVTGSNDTINMGVGGSVTLAAGDTNDTINMIGGTLLLGSSLSGIVVNGTGDQLSGPDSSLAGPVTLASTITTVRATSTGPVVITTDYPGYTPPIVYDAADIPDLVNYFAANPNLSMEQIAEAESDTEYQSSLDQFLTSATLMGSPNSLSSNVLAMLDGYSSIYLAVMGVPASDLSEDAYIEQQIGWVEANYPIPVDEISNAVENLMSDIMSSNPTTQSIVSQAIGLLEAGAAGAPSGNQPPMLDDTTAILELAVAGNPGLLDSGGILGDEVYTPGRTGHWEVEYTLSTNSYTQNFESPPLVTTILDDINAYVTPIVDAAAFFVPGLQVAAIALQALQAGEDFAAGDDLEGAFDVLEAIGGGLNQFGSGETKLFGVTLEQAASTVQDIDGSVNDIQTGNILGLIKNALGAVGNLSDNSETSQFAQIGSALAGTASAVSQGDILYALDDLIYSAYYSDLLPNDPYVSPSSLEQNIGTLYSTFIATEYSDGTEINLGSANGAQVSASMQYADNSGYEINVPDLNLATDAIPFFKSQELFPNSAGTTSDVPSGNSGLTIGWGVDLARQNVIGLAMMGVPDSIIKELPSMYLGIGNSNGITTKLGPVGSEIENPAALTLSESDVEILSTDVINAYIGGSSAVPGGGVQNVWANSNPSQAWLTLPENTQIALSWLYYNGNALQSNVAWHDATVGDWVGSVIKLIGTGGPMVPVGQLILKDLISSGSVLSS